MLPIIYSTFVWLYVFSMAEGRPQIERQCVDGMKDEFGSGTQADYFVCGKPCCNMHVEFEVWLNLRRERSAGRGCGGRGTNNKWNVRTHLCLL